MPSRIYSMSFNTTSTLLCVSSATETVHIFKLGTLSNKNNNNTTTNGNPAENPTTPHPTSTTSSRSRSQSHSPNHSPSPTAPNPTDPAPDPASARKHNGTLLGMIRRTSQNVSTTFAASIGTYLPTAVAEMWEPERDFAWLKIPKASPAAPPLRSVVALSSNGPQVMVVTNEGNFYVFNIDLEKGGEGTLVKQYSMLDASERLVVSGVED